MFRNVVDLRDFYATNAGCVVRRVLRQKIRHVWPDVTGATIMGMGFATPYLGVFNGHAERAFAIMPPRQGALHWPHGEPSLVAMADDEELPFDNASIDRVLMVHSLEFVEKLQPTLREIWRVLSGNGRLLIIAPNRAGVWARTDSTPFGHGTPYSINQLKYYLRENMFEPEYSARALYIPPVNSRVVLSTTKAWERIGGRFFSTFGGVNIVEASKQLISATPVYAAERVKKRSIEIAGVEAEPS